LFTNGDLGGLQSAAGHWLGLPPSACHAADPGV